MWIRSTNRKHLIKVDAVFYEKFNGTHNVIGYMGGHNAGTQVLGRYESKEEALKVIDDICSNIQKDIKMIEL